ncbi:hypothetical protein B4100_0149 [Heyndrickxia coagulans]|nr:hypothetical protein B4100_0149 [Heyndrickxia coagulans]
MSSDCKKCLFVSSNASHIPVNAVIKFEFTIPILIKDKKSFNAEASAAFTLVVVSIVRLSATIVPPSNFSKPFKKNGLTRCRRIPFVNVFTLPIRKTVYYNYNPSFPFWLLIKTVCNDIVILRSFISFPTCKYAEFRNIPAYIIFNHKLPRRCDIFDTFLWQICVMGNKYFSFRLFYDKMIVGSTLPNGFSTI